LTARAANQDVARALVREMAWYDEYLQQGEPIACQSDSRKQDRRTDKHCRKSAGLDGKSGQQRTSRCFSALGARHGQGAHFAATPASDFVCGTLQLAAGMNMHVFTTGRGLPMARHGSRDQGASRSALADRWSDLIDINPAASSTGEATIQEVGEQSST